MAKPIPDGYHSITPSFTFKDCRKAIDFYKQAFGAKLLDLFPRPDGQGAMHATIQIGNSIVMMGDEMTAAENCPKSAETTGSSPISLYLYVPDADASFQQAIAAGAEATMPVADMFWGDRCGTLTDPFGYTWMVATHKQDLTSDEIRKGAEAFFAQMAKQS
jgi:PhnB protein